MVLLSFKSFDMQIGYARVFPPMNRSRLAKDALEKAGCEKIYIEKHRGRKRST